MEGIEIMRLQRIIYFVLLLTLTVATNVSANELPAQRNNDIVREMMITSGKIVEVEGNKVTIKGEGNYPLVTGIITDDTLVLSGKNGAIKSQRKLKKGCEVTLYYSPKMTRSYPPQTVAFAFVLGKNDENLGKFMEAKEITDNNDEKFIRVLGSNQDILVTISESIDKNYKDIKASDKLMVWYKMMTMSIPAQANATKVKVYTK